MASRLAFLRWGVRRFDILVLLAYPTLGAVFALPRLGTEAGIRFALFSALNTFLLTHIYLINDWSDARLHPEEPGQRKVQALKRPEVMAERQVLGLAAGLLAMALAGFCFLSWPLLVISLVIALMTLFYSHPRIHWKGVPVLSTLIHLAGAWLYFLAGWVLFAPLSLQAAAIGLFPALALSAGHFSNEIQDFSSDLQAGIRTNAIAFGQRRVFRLGLFLFTLSSLYLLSLALAQYVIPSLAWIGLLLTVGWGIQSYRYRHWKGGDPLKSFRRFYRVLYALATFAILGLLLWHKS